MKPVLGEEQWLVTSWEGSECLISFYASLAHGVRYNSHWERGYPARFCKILPSYLLKAPWVLEGR
jgi:hypothetical protein